jgi:hypothetical protein
MFKLLEGGTAIEQVWINKDLDNHHGQVLRIGSYIYGSNWIDNAKGDWCCVDWNTGETMYVKNGRPKDLSVRQTVCSIVTKRGVGI